MISREITPAPNTGTTAISIEAFLEEVAQRKANVRSYLFNAESRNRFDATYHYLNMGGKSLRPSVLLFSCGAVGGNEDVALPAAAMVEVYHTWTLVHDDIIDRDEKRRGFATVHTEFAARAKSDLKWQTIEATHYGTTIALLAGDLQQAWVMSLLSELATKQHLSPELVLHIMRDIAEWLQPYLIEGQTLDVQYSKSHAEVLTEAMILDMMWKKTGALYEFAGRTGATIGLGDPTHPYVSAIAKFCGKCGLAFQLQDDILGLVGDEAKVGKPFGSDIREGKHTVIAMKALELASDVERNIILSTLGQPNANPQLIKMVIDIFESLGAVDYVRSLARRLVEEAILELNTLPDSYYKNMLFTWADFMIQRPL
jgi:geranylgeranyl diphosphate synthase, type I